MTPSCSVLITACDLAPYIRASIQSVLTQLRPGDEVIVVDDCSTDTTVDVVARCGAQVQLVRNHARVGSAAARNRAAGLASGDLLVFLDGDDVALAGRLDRHRAAASSGADVSYGRIALIDDEGRLKGWHRETARRSPLPLQRQIMFENPIPFSAAAVSASVFCTSGGFRESVPSSEDWEFWARLVCGHGAQVDEIDERVTAYRLRRGSKTMDWRAKVHSYAKVRELIQQAYGTPCDQLAAAGHRRRVALSTAHNAWRRARLTTELTAYLGAIRFAALAAIHEVRFRWELARTSRSSPRH